MHPPPFEHTRVLPGTTRAGTPTEPSDKPARAESGHGDPRREPTNREVAGRFQLGDRLVSRIGYGAMKLTGPRFMGPPADREAALTVLRRAVALGIDHIDTSDLFGPRLVNQLIREALHPYPPNMVIATRVGSRRTTEGAFSPALSPDALRMEVEDNLKHLGLDVIHLVYLRPSGIGEPGQQSLTEAFQALAGLQQEGLIRYLGLSHVTREQFVEATSIAPVVCVQNHYNLIHREDDAFIDALAQDGTAYTAVEGLSYTEFFPRGVMTARQSAVLDECASRLKSSPIQVVQAWLLARSPNMLLIPGSNSIAQLEENLASAIVRLSPFDLEQLENIGGRTDCERDQLATRADRLAHHPVGR